MMFNKMFTITQFCLLKIYKTFTIYIVPQVICLISNNPLTLSGTNLILLSSGIFTLSLSSFSKIFIEMLQSVNILFPKYKPKCSLLESSTSNSV